MPRDAFPNGNTTVIVGQDGVFVVDAGYLPSAAREDIAQIRRWTSKPVRFLLNTHWHYDHNDGNDEYVCAFPGVEIVSTAATRDLSRVKGQDWGKRATGLARAAIAEFTTSLASGLDARGRALAPEQRADLEWAKTTRENEIREFASMVFQPPTLT